MSTAEDLLYREALYLDERRWDDWLALYAPDAVFWVPAWKSEDEPTDDPDTEVSLVYMPSRRLLEERVERVRSGTSIASRVLPRTAHAISNVLVAENGAPDTMTVTSVCTTQIYDPKRQETRQSIARYEHLLGPAGGDQLLIQRKKILLLNDALPAMLDYYTV